MVMLLGKKVGITQVYDEADKLLPVTVIEAGPCTIMQVKMVETDGYNAIQLGYDDVKPSRRKRPQVGHAQKANTTPKKFVKEMRLPDDVEPGYKVGDSITVSIFAEDKFVDIIGTSKGKGFAGVMKRHGFGGGRATHGSKVHRGTGSIGFMATTGRVPKGKKMPGHMGVERCTVKNLKVVSIDPEKNIVLVKGAIPGHAGAPVFVRKSR